MDLFQVVFWLRRGRFGLSDLKCQLIAGGLNRVWRNTPVCANAKRCPDFDQSFPQAVDLFFLFVDHLGPAGHLPLNRFEGVDLLLQGGDVMVFFAE